MHELDLEHSPGEFQVFATKSQLWAGHSTSGPMVSNSKYYMCVDMYVCASMYIHCSIMYSTVCMFGVYLHIVVIDVPTHYI